MSMMYVRNLVDLHLKYYTDYHNVDEDRRIIPDQGGSWVHNILAGIALRDMHYDPTYSSGDVAYKYNNKNSTPVMRVEF